MIGVTLNRSSVAVYDHLTQTIHLKRAEKENLIKLAETILTPDWDEGLQIVDGVQDVLRPVVHELRHWVDMNCSIRGLKTLSAIFNLVADPTEPNKSIEILKKDISLEHFIERYVPHDGKTHYPWHTQLSTSSPIYDEPFRHVSIVFFAKNDKLRTKTLFKSPIYLGSMLETCATYQEIHDALPLIAGNRKLAPGALLQLERESVSFIQNSELPEYHAISHAVSSHARQTDGRQGFAMASALCTLLINMPEAMIRDSCHQIEQARGPRGYSGPDGARRMREMTWINPEAALIHNALTQLALRSKYAPLPYSDDLIFDLVPLWKKRRSEFFSRSHESFVEAINMIKGPDYFEDSKVALIENNRSLLEQETLTPTILRLPKRPPIVFGDGYVLPAAAEYDKVVPHYEGFDASPIAELLRIKKSAKTHSKNPAVPSAFEMHNFAIE